MEFTIKGHKVSLYGNLFRFVFRIYDKKGYVHFVINTTKYHCGERIWKEKMKDWNGDYNKSKLFGRGA